MTEAIECNLHAWYLECSQGEPAENMPECEPFRARCSAKHLPGKIMIADILTKAVGRALFLELLRLMAE